MLVACNLCSLSSEYNSQSEHNIIASTGTFANMMSTRNLTLAGCLLFTLVQSAIGRLESSKAVRRTETEAEAIRAQADALKGKTRLFVLDEDLNTLSGQPIIKDESQDVSGTNVRILQAEPVISYTFTIKTQIYFLSTTNVLQSSIDGMVRLTEVYLKRYFASWFALSYQNVGQVTLVSWSNLDLFTTELNMQATIVFRTFGNPPTAGESLSAIFDAMNSDDYVSGFVNINVPSDPWVL